MLFMFSSQGTHSSFISISSLVTCSHLILAYIFDTAYMCDTRVLHLPWTECPHIILADIQKMDSTGSSDAVVREWTRDGRRTCSNNASICDSTMWRAQQMRSKLRCYWSWKSIAQIFDLPHQLKNISGIHGRMRFKGRVATTSGRCFQGVLIADRTLFE